MEKDTVIKQEVEKKNLHELLLCLQVYPEQNLTEVDAHPDSK